MNESNGMKTHTSVTVTTDSGPSPQSLEIRLNIGYFKTPSGILKLVQLVLGVICMACAAPAAYQPYSKNSNFGLNHNHWFLFVVVTCFLITLIWTFFHLLQVRDYIKVKLPFTFLKIEVIYTIIATVFQFIAFIVIFAGFGWCTRNTACDARVAGGVFGIMNTVAYGAGAYFVYNEYCSTPPELQ